MRLTGTRCTPTRFRGGLVFKAHRLVHHSFLRLRVIKKEKRSRAQGSLRHPIHGRERGLALFELRLGASSFKWTVNLYQEFFLEKLQSFKKKNSWYKLTVHLNDDAPNLNSIRARLRCISASKQQGTKCVKVLLLLLLYCSRLRDE